MEVREKARNVCYDEQQVEAEAERDDRERLQDADAEEQEREDVRAGFRLTRNRLNRLAGNDTVADGGTERNAGDDKAEGQDRKACNQCFRSQLEYLSRL